MPAPAAKANRVRLERAALRKAVKDGDVDPWELVRGNVDEWEPVARELKLEKLTPFLYGVGDVTLREVLIDLALRSDLKLMALTFERRAELANTLRDSAQTRRTAA